jgi:2-dehydro-3-deoxyglucarate aldolase
VILSWQQIPSPIVTEIMCIGFDGVVLDLEHSLFNNETLAACIQVIRLSNKMCFVRLPTVDKNLIKWVLDYGANGIIFSTIESESQCRDIFEFSLYPPHGKRGLGLVRQNLWGHKELIQKPPILIAQIETKQAVDEIEKLKKYKFDYFLIGPYDLSMSLGIPAKFDDELFTTYLNKIKLEISNDKLAVHIPENIEKELAKYHGYGLKCIGMDTVAIKNFNKRNILDA